MTWWNDYIGISFVEKGRTRSGVDCWGLVHLVYAERLGIALPSYTECYATTHDRECLASLIGQEKEDKWVEVEEPKEFDVIVLRIEGLPFHVGLYTHAGRFIHSESGRNTNIAKLDSLRWRKNVVGVFRWAK